MLNILYTELLKLKRIKLLYIILIPSFFTAFIEYKIHSGGTQYPLNEWDGILGETNILMLKYAPIFLVILAGYIFTREHKDNSMNSLFTYPVARIKLYICKLLIMLPVIFVTFLLTMLIFVFLGQFLPHDTLTSEIIIENIKILLWMVLLNFALTPLAVLVAIITKKNLPVVVYGILGFFLLIMLLLTKYKIYFPLCFPSIIAAKMFGYGSIETTYLFNNCYGLNYTISLSIFIAVTVISTIAGIILYKKTEVQ